jgi:hypothetical protein
MPGICSKCGIRVERGVADRKMCAEPGIFWRFRPLKCCECALSQGNVSNDFFDKWACLHCKRRLDDREAAIQRVAQNRDLEARELFEKAASAASSAAEWERELRTQAEERERKAVTTAHQERDRREEAVTNLKSPPTPHLLSLPCSPPHPTPFHTSFLPCHSLASRSPAAGHRGVALQSGARPSGKTV